MKLTYLEEAYKSHINATKYRMQAIEMHLDKIQPLRLKQSSGVLGYIGKFIFGTNDLEDQIHNVKEIEEDFEKHTNREIDSLSAK
jgi:hypothetical protein